jgi:hypothetical protein
MNSVTILRFKRISAPFWATLACYGRHGSEYAQQRNMHKAAISVEAMFE